MDTFETLASDDEIAAMKSAVARELSGRNVDPDILDSIAASLAHLVTTRDQTIAMLNQILTLQTKRLLLVQTLRLLTDEQIERVTSGAAGPELRQALLATGGKAN